MHVIATAGHVDHGKSTLVRALTGMEPDRYAEERRRGMTIDLGYAWADLPSGDTVAFVDVPGHQRFISTMLSGIGPVPAVMLVVAADEGWCRQTGEHLAALRALDVRHGVLAITRSDLGDADLAAEEAHDHLAGTSLAGMETVAVSGVTGQGLDALRAALGRMVATLPEACGDALFTRLWVDRVFSVRGAGTVVTGTLGSGRISIGDDLVLTPTGQTVRVRGIETLQQSADSATAVSRVAVNLRAVATHDIRRGQALIASGGWIVTDVLDARLIDPGPKDLPRELILHVGSAAVPVRLRPLGSETVRLTAATPVPLHAGERALLRDPGRQQIAAGLVVLDVDPLPLRRRGSAAVRAAELQAMPDIPDANAEIGRRGAVLRSRLIAAGVLLPHASVTGPVQAVGDWLIDREQWNRWVAELVDTADHRAAEHPMAPGISRDAAARSLGLPDPGLVDALTEAAGLTSDTEGIHRPDVTAALTPDAAASVRRLRERLASHPFRSAEAADLAELGLTEQHLAVAMKLGLLARVGENLFRPEDLGQVPSRLAELPQPFSASQARELLGTTRRVVIPLLEHLDRLGQTRRVDANLRIVLEENTGSR